MIENNRNNGWTVIGQVRRLPFRAGELRLEVSEYKGNLYASMRVWRRVHGEWRPHPSVGVTFTPGELRAVASVLPELVQSLDMLDAYGPSTDLELEAPDMAVERLSEAVL